MARAKAVHVDSLLPIKDRVDDERKSLLARARLAPKDVCQLAYVVFFLHGIGHLLPWNFFITAQQYFEMKFTCPDGNNTEHCTGFNSSFENWFSVASMIPIFIMSALNVWLQSKFHYKRRMIISLIVMLILFILTTALVGVPVTHWTDGFFALTLLTVFIMNAASSVFQSSTFGFAGVLPHKYTSAVMSGQAVAGVFATLASIFSQLISSSLRGGQQSSSTITDSAAYGYFGIACLVLILCLISVFMLNRMPFVHHYLEQTSVQVSIHKKQKAVEASVHTRVIVRPSYYTILRKVLWYAVSVYLVFTVTLSVFPALISHIVPADPHNSGDYFTLLVCFLMFNVSDLTGRFITHWIQIGSHHVTLLLFSALRCVFIPAFMLCNARVKGYRSLPTYDSQSEYDVIPIILVTIFGLSNGYLGSIAMVTAPQRVRDDEKETASTIMAFFLSGGLFSGGALSFLWTYLINP